MPSKSLEIGRVRVIFPNRSARSEVRTRSIGEGEADEGTRTAYKALGFVLAIECYVLLGPLLKELVKFGEPRGFETDVLGSGDSH